MGSSRFVDEPLPSVLLEPLKPIVESSSRYFRDQSYLSYVFAFLELSDAPASKPQFVSRLLQQSLHDSFSRRIRVVQYVLVFCIPNGKGKRF